MPLGRRERNKREKMTRIVNAARALFGRQGFEATTIRQIADAADVGLGTVFSYAANKDDLLVLVFQEDTIRAVDRAFARLPNGGLLDQVLHIVGAITAQHAKNRDLANIFVKEVPFLDDRRSIADFMFRVFSGLVECVDRAKARGEIEPDIPAPLLASNLFAIYFQQLRMWLRGKAPELDESFLRAALELQIGGLRSPAAAAAPSRRARSRQPAKCPRSSPTA
jgi:AcrR family transcriptional regulator